jgi:hypothetical protein
MADNQPTFWEAARHPERFAVSVSDGPTYQLIRRDRIWVYCILFTLALLFLFLPHDWLDETWVRSITETVTGYWPKLSIESSRLNVIDPQRGARYVAATCACIMITSVFFLFMTLPRLVVSITAVGRPLTKVQKIFAPITFIFSVLTMAMILFDLGIVAGDTRIGRSLISSNLIVFWAAALSAALFDTFVHAAAVIAKATIIRNA